MHISLFMKFTVIFANVDCREPKKVSKRFQEDDRALPFKVLLFSSKEERNFIWFGYY